MNSELRSKVNFCNIDKEKLDGYTKACGISIKSDDSLTTVDLYEQFKTSALNQYTVSMPNIFMHFRLLKKNILGINYFSV